MPKKSFKANTSTVFVKRKKIGQIIKNSNLDKKCSKFILIDGNNEKNWKILKTELGCKTDTSFLEYLLTLAQKDLDSTGGKKITDNPENEAKVKVSVRNSPKSIKKINNGNDSAVSQVGKFRATSNELEKAKEKGNSVVFKLTDATNLLLDENKINCILHEEKGKRSNGSDPNQNRNQVHFYDYEKSRPNGLKFKLYESSKNLAQNTKTDFAKDLALENNSIEISQTLENLIDGPIKSTKSKDLKFCKETENDDAEEKGESSCRDKKKSGCPVLKRNDFLKVKKNRSKEKMKKRKSNQEGSRKYKQRKKKESKDSAELSGRNSTETFRVAIKIKLCLLCNTRHVVGECPAEKTEKGQIVSVSEEGPQHSERGSFFRKNSEKFYDFNEIEKNRTSITVWRPEISNFQDEKIEDYAEINGTEDYDPDSGSDSETKLKIDECFGENLSFAESTLPDYLELKVSDEQHGFGVFAKIILKKGTEFGPLIGEKIKEMDIPDDFDMKHIWEVNSGQSVKYLCTRDAEASNWLRYLRPASFKESANLAGVTKEGTLWFSVTREVVDGEELVYWTNDTHSAWSKKKLEKKNCGGCNLRFNHPLYYQKHCMIFHDPSCSLTIRKYHCKVCGVAVLGKEKIMKHAAEMHQGKGAYQCQFCLKFFLRLNYLEMHRTYGCSKNPQRSRPLCDLCGRKFCQPQKLKVHIKRMHSDMAQVLKDFQCKSCLKILGSRAALQRHMKEVHNKDIVGACTCDRCGKMFQNKSNLKIHMLTHSGVKPFKCQQSDCSAAFTTKQCLQFHYKKVHGFSDGFIPKIERSIAYTFDAYSGGAVSDPGSSISPKFEESNASPNRNSAESKDCGLDLSLVLPPADDFRGNKSRSCEKSMTACSESSPLPSRFSSYKLGNREDDEENSSSSVCEASCTDEKSLHEPSDVPANKIIASKGSKKWMGPIADGENESCKYKSIFKQENSDASLLVEAAISAAEKDIEPSRFDKGTPNDEIPSRSETYSLNRYANDSPGAIVYEEKKPEEYEKRLSDSPKLPKKIFPAGEKSNFNDILKCNTLLRISTSPLTDVPKDYNVGAVRDQDEETFNDLEIHDYRSRDLSETYKENEAFHEHYRIHDFYRNDKPDYSEEFRPSSADKYRDSEVTVDCYRNLAGNLEKYRNADVYRLRSEIYDFGGMYRDASEERDGQVQNLCLKEKSLQYETLEELARIGRDNPGFECLLVGDSSNANPGSLGLPRGLHGMPSPRSYHPATYETESVDLSVPRPPYSSPPIYSLDLTPARLDLPSSRHVDLRSHLGLSPHRFSNGRASLTTNGSSPVSPTDYSVYPSPYVAPASRPSPTSQFQPYTSLYY